MPLIHKTVDPESAHRLGVWAAKHKMFSPGWDRKKDLIKEDSEKLLKNCVFGLNFDNPVGLAAGFDKDAECIEGMAKVGFGFLEIGSVTPKPQLGNEKPRVFRLNEDKGIINRYGFNSQGHDAVLKRLQEFRSLKDNQNSSVILGVNLGKNKTSTDSIADYVQGVQKLGPYADYLVVNISSPNTPGLRSLQSQNELKSLLSAVLKARDELNTKGKIPLLVKVAPDLTEQDKVDIAEVVTNAKTKVDGLIISNTTVSRPDALVSVNKNETGGLSGRPLTALATRTISDFYKLTRGHLPIIGVGGIFNGVDAADKICAGASLIQIYSSMIYEGPPIVNKIKRELKQELRSRGFQNLQEAIASNHKK